MYFVKLHTLNSNSVEMFLKFFMLKCKQLYRTGLNYGILIKYQYILEKAHLFALKKCLGLDMRSLNDLVYGETEVSNHDELRH